MSDLTAEELKECLIDWHTQYIVLLQEHGNKHQLDYNEQAYTQLVKIVEQHFDNIKADEEAEYGGVD